MNWKQVPRIPEDDDEEIKMVYDAFGESILQAIQDADAKGLPAVYAMNLLLDKGIDLAYFLSPSEEQATAIIEMMQREVRARRQGDSEAN